MHRSSLHLSPLADLLGTLLLLTVPNFNPVVVERLQLQVAGCGLAGECHPVPLKLGISPTVITLRLDEAPLLRFGLAFDQHDRPQLWPLEAELAQVRQEFPQMTTVQLEIDDDVELGLLIAVADLCIGAGYPNILAAPDPGPPLVGSSLQVSAGACDVSARPRARCVSGAGNSACSGAPHAHAPGIAPPHGSGRLFGPRR